MFRPNAEHCYRTTYTFQTLVPEFFLLFLCLFACLCFLLLMVGQREGFFLFFIFFYQTDIFENVHTVAQ